MIKTKALKIKTHTQKTHKKGKAKKKKSLQHKFSFYHRFPLFVI